MKAHPVYPNGPPCSPHCPGEWSTYHEGYADGRGERHAATPAENGLDGEHRHGGWHAHAGGSPDDTSHVHYQPFETGGEFLWRQKRAARTALSVEEPR